MRKRYQHLEQIRLTEYNWRDNLLRRSLPERAFANELTKNIILAVQMILVKGFDTADMIKRYFRF